MSRFTDDTIYVDGNIATDTIILYQLVDVISITSDEATAKNAKDKFTPDAEPDCIGTDTAWVRQERDAHGDGRVYVVTFVASDGRGGETEMTLPLRVPHDGKGNCEAVDSGQKYDATEEVMK